jgi:hypothetical protein
MCPYCEAAIEEEPSEEDKAMVWELLGQMPPEALAELQSAIEKSSTAEEFANRIFIGECPTCGSEDTGNCENDPDIGELVVGRCYECGQLWCTLCDRLLEPGQTTCPCWEEDEEEA